MKRYILSFGAIVASLVIALFFYNGDSSIHANQDVKIGESLEEALKNNLEIYEVIITYDQDKPVSDDQLNFLDSLGISTGVTMETLPIAGVLATKSQIETLKEQDDILSIYLNEELEYFNAKSTDLTGVERARRSQEFQNVNDGFPFTGDSVGVVVHDSGVDGLHKDHEFGQNLVQNVMASLNLNALDPELLPVTYVEDVKNTDTNSGHGTHVAGTVGGTGAHSGGKYEGVAPGADLIGYGSGAALFILDGIGGFDYAVTNQTRYDIRVITNSWGSSGDFDPYHPINVASKKAYDRGITVLFAAGNSGPGENTHNPYAKAPWVISVGAGVKDGTLADFSSRGTKDGGGTFIIDGQEFTWRDEPTVVAPGVDIISTKTTSPLAVLSVEKDAEMIETAYLPYYTVMSGTSMATPHVAGIVALLLEADPTLSPDEVKAILQNTATNMPGYESWEVGAGYVNAYAALDSVLFDKDYGSVLNINQDFNSHVETTTEHNSFTIDYDPLGATSNSYLFEVEEGVAGLSARIDGKGLYELTGNPVNLVLVDPNGEEYSSGVSLLFTLYFDRVVQVSNPIEGEWELKVIGLRGHEVNPLGLALPEEVEGTIRLTTVSDFTGLNDVEGHSAEDAIKLAVSNRLVDGFNDNRFMPNQNIKREDLARYLVMGTGIRQNLDLSGQLGVDSELDAYASAVASQGAAIKDAKQYDDGVMIINDGQFDPRGNVARAELSYSLVQALGLQEEAKDFDGDITVQYKDEHIVLEDQDDVPEHLRGYVQLAINLNMMNVNFDVEQDDFALEPEITATFSPDHKVTRGEYAATIVRYYEAFLK